MLRHDVTATTNAFAASHFLAFMISLRADFLLNLRGGPRATAPSKPAPGRLDAIEAQIRDEIAVMQGVMICYLRQNEHLVRLDAPEVRRVIEVRIAEPRVHAIAVVER